MSKEYILITPVHNEETYIERTIKCVIAQSIPPKKWLLIDDDSTDKTAEIIRQYEWRYNFMNYFHLQRDNIETYYARRTRVFMSGYERIKGMEYAFLGSLDADISLKPTYYESILEEFNHNPRLGVASGIYLDDVNGRLRRIFRPEISTPGAIQMFRRECYEEIDGYVPLKYGGDDSLAEIKARMYGWETRSFSQYQVVHHRLAGTGSGTCLLYGKFRQGLADYGLGTHPVFMLAKSLLRVFWERPFFLAGAARMTGYLCAHLGREKIRVPDEVVKFLRKEQIKRLITCFCCHKSETQSIF